MRVSRACASSPGDGPDSISGTRASLFVQDGDDRVVRGGSADVEAHPYVVEAIESVREPDDYLNHPVEAWQRRHVLNRELVAAAGRVLGLGRDVGGGGRGHARREQCDACTAIGAEVRGGELGKREALPQALKLLV
jgi:hypothetical protein